MAKIMGLVVTGTERQGKLVQGGETEAKGQKGKVQVRRESLVWTHASSFFLELFGRTFARTFPNSLTMLAWNCRVGSDLIDPLEGGQKKEEWPVVLVWPSTLLEFAPRLGQCHHCHPFKSRCKLLITPDIRPFTHQLGMRPLLPSTPVLLPSNAHRDPQNSFGTTNFTRM